MKFKNLVSLNCNAIMEASDRQREMWTVEEDLELLEGVNKNKSVEELAELHQRSSLHIRLRLANLFLQKIDDGEITAKEVFAKYPITPQDMTILSEYVKLFQQIEDEGKSVEDIFANIANYRRAAKLV